MTHVTQYYGTNPRGLSALEEWQTDVTKMPEFGRFKYVHVTVDTFSHAMVASAFTGEKTRDAIRHFYHAFSILGVPCHVKTDNGPAYASQKMQAFFRAWGIEHSTGIPHVPTGQAIIERAHGLLKRQVQKQKGGMQQEPPQVRLDKAVYVLNFLRPLPDSQLSPIFCHFSSLNSKQPNFHRNVKVWVKDLITGIWSGPVELITWGRGYACVLTDNGPRWVPARCVKPYLERAGKDRIDGSAAEAERADDTG